MGGMADALGAALGFDKPSKGAAPSPAAPPAPQGPPLLYPAAQPPPGVGPVGTADGQTTKGFLQGMLGQDFQMGPGRAIAPPGYQPAPPPPSQWVYQQGKGPVWQGYEKGRTQGEYKPVFNPTFTGNRF